ncbi:hypothetical protein PVMG_05927 [Plasmodium vivax Mauritania I]|uniref:PIR Superfamily Protein n=1 Tax=Plasmodium vivax Mauritania I TaxID=1035515 RepID=A0A0J9T4S7_PLAVI|nr:hypothetical protein PVMG_05927 [Plasmodium vivax Mauritania I]
MNYIAPDANYCEGAQFKYNNGNQVVDICKDMVKLFNNAIFKNVIILNPLTENKVPEFINYWINSRLTQSGFNDNIKPEIFPKLNSITHHFDGRGLLKGKIYHIKEKEVDGMNILYELYKNIHEFEQKKTEHFKNFLENFMTNYNKGLIKCFYEGNVKFCHELNKYREFYEGNKKKELSEICDNKECPSLTELTLLASASKKEHLNIAEIGSKLIKGSDISSLNGLSFLETEDVY